MKYYNQDINIHHSDSERHKMEQNSDMSQSKVKEMSQKFDKTEQRGQLNSQIEKLPKAERSQAHGYIKQYKYSDIIFDKTKFPIWAITFTLLCLISFAITIIVYKY